MLYGSTRGGSFDVTAPEAILRGIAPDGGLYVPENIPDLSGLKGESFLQTARQILAALFPEFALQAEAMAGKAYAGHFSHPDITPLVPVGDSHVLELFHGPTAAFKDVALCALPLMMNAARGITGDTDEILILTATSGDTGSAALAGFRNVPGIRILVFYPEDGVSPVQKAQMVTMAGKNLKVCGVRGNFDDAQTGVKEVFASYEPPEGLALSSANSINIGRLVPQMTYYFTAYAALVRQGAIQSGDQVNFVVPTGNFGDILAGYLAKKAGLPVGKLVCAANANDVLKDFIQTGLYDRRRALRQTLSPSMDILVSSNLERLLYFVSYDPAFVAGCMEQLKNQGFYQVPKEYMEQIQDTFLTGACSDKEGLDAIEKVWQRHHYLMDPHTAAAWKVKEELEQSGRLSGANVVLSTASPFKFPGAMAKALSLALPDDASAAETLGQRLGLPVPQSLTGLQAKPVLHQDVIDPRDMLAYVQNKAVGSW